MKRGLCGLLAGAALLTGCANQKDPSVYSWEVRNRQWSIPRTFMTEVGRAFYSVTEDSKPKIAELDVGNKRFIDYGADGTVEKVIIHKNGNVKVYDSRTKNNLDLTMIFGAQFLFDYYLNNNGLSSDKLK